MISIYTVYDRFDVNCTFLLLIPHKGFMAFNNMKELKL